ncbi:MAG: amidohydrolase family protein [Actinomycetota bacterium]
MLGTPSGPVAVVGATAWVGPRLSPVPDAVVVMVDGAIAAVGARAATPVPDGAVAVDAAGTTLVPGFIDAHVHIGLASPKEVVRGGVTTVRDLGWPPELIFPLVERAAAPSFEGPRVLAAGPILTAPGGYPTRAAWAPAGTGLQVASPARAEPMVERVAALGATVIKVALNPPAGPTLDLAVLSTIVAAAHDRGLKVTGHVAGVSELEKALDAGMDELAHMLMTPEGIPDALLEAMVATGMTVVPTLSIRAGGDRAIAVENLRRFVGMGGRIVYGTDLGNAGPRPGIDPLEVGALREAGLSARAVVAAATVDAAEWLGLAGAGVLEPGAPADLVALDGDLDRDPAGLTRPRLVFRGGIRAR